MSSTSPVGVARGLVLTAVTARAYPDLWAEPAWLSSNGCRSGMKMATKRANTTVQAPNRKGGPGMSSFYHRAKNRRHLHGQKLLLIVCACASANLDFLRPSYCWLHIVQLHIEQEEDEAVESRTQTVAQPSDTCDHALGHTCTRAHTVHETGQQAERGQSAHTHPADQVMHSVTPEQRLLGR